MKKLPALLLTCVCGAWGAWTRIELPGKVPVRWVHGSGNELYAASDSGMFESHDEGATWDSLRIRFPGSKLRVYLMDGANLYLGGDPGIFHSHDHGLTWTAPDTAYRVNFITTLIAGHGVLYGGSSWEKGAFRSKDSGATWEPFKEWLPTGGGLHGLIKIWGFDLHGGRLFAATEFGIYRVGTGGTRWESAATGLPRYPFYKDLPLTYQVLSFAGSLYAVSFHGIYKSEDNGDSWKASDVGLPPEFSEGGSRRTSPLMAIKETMYVDTDFGLYYSTDSARTWKNLELSTDPQRIQFLAGTERFVFASTDSGELLRRPLKYATRTMDNPSRLVGPRVGVDRSPSGWTVAYQTSSAVPIRLELRDGSGRRILSRSMMPQAPGTQMCVLGTGFSPGMYLLALRDGARIERMKIRIDG